MNGTDPVIKRHGLKIVNRSVVCFIQIVNFEREVDFQISGVFFFQPVDFFHVFGQVVFRHVPKSFERKRGMGREAVCAKFICYGK